MERCHGLPVLTSIQPVVRNSRWVRFDPRPIDSTIQRWGHLLTEELGWEHPCHVSEGTVFTARWIFILDVLNHCFWPDPGNPPWSVHYQGNIYSGYWALAAAMKRAVDEGFPITDARYLVDISREDFLTIFRGCKGEIPMLEERYHNLREAGRNLLKYWDGGIENLLTAAKGCVIKALDLIVECFPSFRDQATYKGNLVFFWKRAQLFLADLYSAFHGTSWGTFKDIHCLTACADYKLPQVLRSAGILRYHPALAAKIEARERLTPGCEEEVEIRALTILAVEAIKNAFHGDNRRITSIHLDRWLWQLGQLPQFRGHPYHLCRTIFY